MSTARKLNRDEVAKLVKEVEADPKQSLTEAMRRMIRRVYDIRS